MDNLLESLLKLAFLVKESKEGEQWRHNLASLTKLEFDYTRFHDDAYIFMPEIILAIMNSSDALRHSPLNIWQLLMAKCLPWIKDPERKTQEILSKQSSTLDFNMLHNNYQFSHALIYFLRKQAEGFPHDLLIYSLPSSHWVHMSKFQSFPFYSNNLQLPKLHAPSSLNWQKWIPSISNQFLQQFQVLLDFLHNHPISNRLRKSYEGVINNPKAVVKLRKVRNDADKTLREAFLLGETEWVLAAKNLEQKLLEEKDILLSTYIDSFHKYEQLIQSIYELFVHIVVYEEIVALVEDRSNYLEQLAFRDNVLSAVSSLAFGIKMSTIYYLSIPECNGEMDGFYRTTQLNVTFDRLGSANSLIQARKIWLVPFTEVIQKVNSFSSSGLFNVKPFGEQRDIFTKPIPPDLLRAIQKSQDDADSIDQSIIP